MSHVLIGIYVAFVNCSLTLRKKEFDVRVARLCQLPVSVQRFVYLVGRLLTENSKGELNLDVLAGFRASFSSIHWFAL